MWGLDEITGRPLFNRHGPTMVSVQPLEEDENPFHKNLLKDSLMIHFFDQQLDNLIIEYQFVRHYEILNVGLLHFIFHLVLLFG